MKNAKTGEYEGVNPAAAPLVFWLGVGTVIGGSIVAFASEKYRAPAVLLAGTGVVMAGLSKNRA